MTQRWLYTIRERFTPAQQDRFDDYRSFSGFKHIRELVTLDNLMCPDVVDELTLEDWQHNVQEDFRTELFDDPDYLLRRQPLDGATQQVIAACERPDADATVPDRFTRCGYDIIDSWFGNSTLTNCGPAPDIFQPSDVNALGLLDHRDDAYRIRDEMRRQSPEDPHFGACEVWLLARLLPNGR